MLADVGAPRVYLSFDVTLTEIKMELFTSADKDGDGIMGEEEEQQQQPLSKLLIQGLAVSGQMMSNGLIKSSVTLTSMLIEDPRPLVVSTVTSPTSPTSPTKRFVERAITRLLYLTEAEGGDRPHRPEMLRIDYEVPPPLLLLFVYV